MRVKSEDVGQKKIQKIWKAAACDDEGADEGDLAFKKGPWLTTEDAILVDYVQKHGEGNWNTVQKNSGLSRCGKSCRLRWTNHLRPDLKKGTFSEEEELRIIELHAKYGNKWARMATELPGRTDNEIKNFWNTRIKRLQRTDRTTYPLEIFPEHHAENGEFSLHDIHSAGSNYSDLLQEGKLEIPLSVLDFEKLKGSRSLPCLISSLHKVTSLHSPKGNCLSDSRNLAIPLMPPLKRFRSTETPFPFVNVHERCDFPPVHVFTYSPEVVVQPLLVPDPQSSHFASTNIFSQPLLGVVPGRPANINGNFHSSEFSFETPKMELPSFQYPDARLNRESTPSPPFPTIGRPDDLNPSPPTDPHQSDYFFPQGCSGLLEDIIYNATCFQNPVEGSSPRTTDNSSVFPNLDSNLGQDFLDLITSSVSDEGASSSIPESSPDEHQPFVADGDIFDVLNKMEESDEMDSSRPDAVLNSIWFG